MCKWTATLYRCEHFTLRITESCGSQCLGVDQLTLVLKKNGGVFDWCPHKCGRLIEAGRQSELVARSQAPGSGQTDMETFDKMYLLAGGGEEVRENDYSIHGMGFADFIIALTFGMSRLNDGEGM